MIRLLVISFVAAAMSACVTVYQPVTTLQRPVTVDPGLPNLEGLNLLVRCVPSGDGADQGESEELCQNMQQLYSNQGARVETEVPEEEGGGATKGGFEDWGEKAKPDLVIELRARRLHWENSPVLWALCYASLTLVPAITEATFAQDVSIRDADGFLLIQDTLQARFIRYFGLGFWAVNGLLDLLVRPKGQGLVGNNHKTDFSRDFHGQMSQLAFHARMRERVLKSFEPEPVRPVEGQEGGPPPKGKAKKGSAPPVTAPPAPPTPSRAPLTAPPPPPPSGSKP